MQENMVDDLQTIPPFHYSQGLAYSSSITERAYNLYKFKVEMS